MNPQGETLVLVTPSVPGFRSLAAGAAGGISSVLVGHPFDLVKVRLQIADCAARKSALDVLKAALARESSFRVVSNSMAPISVNNSRVSTPASPLR